MSEEPKSTPPSAETPPPPSLAPASPLPVKSKPWRLIVIGVVVLLILSFGIPAVLHSFRFVSTDDAYVNSYVTFVAPRVAGQVEEVLVEDNNRVKKGDILVQLDPEPYQVKVAIKQSALDAAKASLLEAEANAQSLIAQARSDRFKLVHEIENVDNQVAVIRQRAATLEQSRATLKLAQSEFDRSKGLLSKKVVSQEEFDRSSEALSVAQSQVTQALENVYQARAALGLPAQPLEGQKLTDVPEDLDQNFSSVREALAELIHSGAQLGVVPSSFNLTPKQTIEEFYKRDPNENIDQIYAEVVKNAPSLRQAQTVVEQAERDLDQAKLDLRYTKIVSEIEGVVTGAM